MLTKHRRLQSNHISPLFFFRLNADKCPNAD
uniref:Uncharacterized protein n=1 Tax=Arundo donax TaxID=35708 RepID=A0A0A9EC13_ARUDO